VFLFIAAMAKKIVFIVAMVKKIVFIGAMAKKIVIPSEAEGPCVFSFLSRTLRKRGSWEAATATTTHVATGDSPVRRGSAAPPPAAKRRTTMQPTASAVVTDAPPDKPRRAARD